MNEPSRARRLGFASLLALGVNGVVGVGVFFVPADLAARAPGWSSVGVVAATAAALAPIAMMFAALAGRFDDDGGPVVYARAAFGDAAAFVVGWVAYVSALASSAAVVAGLLRATGGLLGLAGAWHERGAAVGLLTLMVAISLGGVTLSARVWSALTIAKLVPLLALVAAMAVLPSGNTSQVGGLGQGAGEGAPVTAGALLGAGLIATFAFQGFEIVPVVAGQAAGGPRVVSAAVVGSLAAPAVLYVLLQIACVTALPGLATSKAPLVEAAAAYGGQRLAALVAAGTSVSAIGIAFGMVAMTPRYLSSLASDGSIGFGLGEVSARGVPVRAAIVTWVLVVVLLAMGERAELFALSSVAVLAQYGVTAAALVALARRRHAGMTPWLGWLAAPSLLVVVALLGGARAREWVVAAVAVAIGLGLRALGRARTRRRAS